MSGQPSARAHCAAELREWPECRYGYPVTQLQRLLGDRWPEFCEFHVGQTCTICEGKSWDYESRVWRPNGCGPHDVVVYSHDLRRFLHRLAKVG